MSYSTGNVRCRFAPSPTGNLHVGGARTALFNYLFARKHGGVHILRIEDTDRERSTPEAVDAILKGLAWLNIPYDEGPYFQSQRTEVYREYARKLLRSGHAYRCTCSEERLTKVREEQKQSGKKPQYDRLHRPSSLVAQADTLPEERGEPFVIRLRVPEQGEIIFHDSILGEIRTQSDEVDDFIIVRSDGSPTYNFTVVVDDIEMAISHVIRGMDHVSNTPKQLVIYQALAAKPPQFAHVPMILGEDKKKLSKRHGATNVFDYKQEGYLPDGFVNYLARLGWSHGDQEIFERHELESLFSLEHVGKSAAVFDFNKLLWVNAEHIKRLSEEKLAEQLIATLNDKGLAADNLLHNQSFLKLVATLRERAKTLREMAEQCHWFFIPESALQYEAKAREKHLSAEAKIPLTLLIEKLETLDSFTESQIESCFQETLTAAGISLVKLAQPVRVAITGTSVSPPIYTVLEVLGKSRTLARLKKAVATI